MNLHINDKFSLQDLVTKGSAARRYVKPDVLISDPTGGLFSEGDIIDANAVFRLVKEMSQGTDSHSMMELIQQLQQEIDELKANPVGPKHIILTQLQYDSLKTYEKDAIYLIVEKLNNRWTFGDKFPIVFGSGWKFGDTFPIQL